MKRLIPVALASALLVCSLAACKAAHHAGNDSMRAPGGAITSMRSPSRTARVMVVGYALFMPRASTRINS